MKPDLEKIEQKINYFFNDKKLLRRALTHRSMRGEHNERLEFLGDSILNFIIARALYAQLPHAKEGDLSRYRAKLVCEEMLASIALEFDLGSFLILGPGELRSGGFRRKSTVADALEALIAAVYLDSNFIDCQKLVESWFATRLIDVTESRIKKDPKSMLQEYLQSCKLPLPYYKVIKVSGEDHDQTFHVVCCVDGLAEKTLGVGSSRRIAEQEAALSFFNIILPKHKQKKGKK